MVQRESDVGPAANSRDRVDGVRSRIVRWLFLEADRRLIAGIISGGIFVTCVALARVDLITLDRADPITRLLISLIGGMLPFITVVLAIVQLILSEEFGSTGAFQDRLDETETFRKQVERDTDTDVSPTDPKEFLQVILGAINRRATTLREACADDPTSGERKPVTEFAEDLTRFTEGESRRLADAKFGTFEIISVLLEYNDTKFLHSTRRLKVRAVDSSSEMRDVLDEIEDLLEDIHVTRQYFKVVHVQQELADLSRLLLYVGFPAVVGGGFFILGYDNLLTAGLGELTLILLASLVFTLAFSPFAVLLAYILRIATIARRTAADFGPFDLRRGPKYR